MSNASHKKRKLNMYRLLSVILAVVIIAISSIIIITVLVKKNVPEKEEIIASEEWSDLLQENVAEEERVEAESTEEESIVEQLAEEWSETETAEEQKSEEQSETNVEEGGSDETEENEPFDLSDPASIVANWETIPAGTIVDASVIDVNNLSQYFVAYEISDAVLSFIDGKSYQDNPDVKLSDLRYMKLLHYNFNHELQVGELIVAADLQSDFIGIFTELFQAEYEIQSMYLPDNYWTGDPTTTDSASIDVNNTSCFMYRPATGSGKLSKHAYGRAIDINPQQNPYVSYTSGSPVWSHENANDYIDRTTGLPHVITEADTCYQIFIKYGFSWGGSWANTKDYQHFYK